MKRYLLYITGQLLLILLFGQTKCYGQAFSSFSYAGPQTYTQGVPIASLSPTVSGGPAAAGGNTTQAFVGNGAAASLDGTGTSAYFSNPLNTAVDADGNVYVADAGNHKIRKVSPDGIVTTFAGTGVAGYLDGPGNTARFQHPSALTVDASGNVFVSDQQNHRIRKITPAGVVSTFAGSGTAGFANGTGTSASFSSPIGLAFDAWGTLYVADYSNHRIRAITIAGVVSTFAGTGTAGMTNGPALTASFKNPMGIAIDISGNLFIADRLNHSIRKITSAGSVTTLAGSGSAGSANGTGTSATFNEPNNLAVDGSGDVYVADRLNNMIRKVTSAGVVTAFAGTTTSGTVNGTGSVVRFVTPYGMCIDKQGNIYIAQNSSNLIRKLVTQPYNIYPLLPSGLSFNNTNGQISGTPTIAQSPRTFYLQAFNTTHSSTVATLTIGVSSLPAGITGSSNQNYIAIYLPQNDTYTSAAAAMSASTNRDNVQTTIQYFDGLGRPSQTVQVMGSNDGLKDVVIPVEYDDLGRLKKSFLPYAATTANGSYKTDALTYVGTFYNSASTNRVVTAYPFSVPVYEPSPLNRIAEQGAPGVSWQPVTGSTAGHTQKIVYGVNSTADTVKYWGISGITVSTSANYAAGQLVKTISKDENWVSGNQGTVEEYKDMEDNVVCKRVWESNTVARSTHYVYDEYNRLRYVIPPKVTATSLTEGGALQFKELVYAYHYDAKGRLIEKKIPGKGWEEFAYDRLDRLTMSRDTVQRIAGKWLFTKYDGQGRVAYTGRIASTATRATHQTALDGATYVYCQRDNTNGTGTASGYTSTSLPNTVGAEIYTVNYYDDYSFWGNPYGGATGVQGTAVKGLLTGTRVNTLPAGSTLITANYYDGKGQLIQTKSNNLLSGTDVTDIAYNFNGSVKNTVRTHTVSTTVTTMTTRYKYDHMGRKLTTKMQMQTKVGTAAATVGPETVISKLEYNPIGQLYKKYLHSTDSSTYLQNTSYRYNERGWLKRQLSAQFSLKLSYDSTANIQYNGNIARQEFGTAASFPNVFSYTYDKLNRLTNGTSTGIVMSEVLSYDANGNITSMNRDGAGAGSYSYINGGNRLNQISGGGLAAGTYAYDFNGNATTDGRTGITMTYNVLNLPATAVRSTNPVNVAYTYDATGNKLKKAVTAPGISTRTYVSGIEYEGNTIDIIQTEEGIVRNSGGNYTYEYNLTDHLGNVRYVFGQTLGPATALQKTNYYPFGQKKVAAAYVNNYLYNGKELQAELTNSGGADGEYDYEARFYDPVIGRWNVVDPMAEKYYGHTPYAYANNSPIAVKDIDGKDVDPSRLDDEEQKKKLLEFLMTNMGKAFVKDFLKKGQSFSIKSEGKNHIFKNGGEDGKFANDLLIFGSSDNLGAGTGIITGGLGITRKADGTDLLENKYGEKDYYNVNEKLVAQIWVLKGLSSDELSVVFGHEAFVHVKQDLNKIEQLRQEVKNGKIIPGSKEYELKLELIGRKGNIDHNNLGKGLITDFKNHMHQLDVLKNTNRYIKLYNENEKQFKN